MDIPWLVCVAFPDFPDKLSVWIYLGFIPGFILKTNRQVLDDAELRISGSS